MAPPDVEPAEATVEYEAPVPESESVSIHGDDGPGLSLGAPVLGAMSVPGSSATARPKVAGRTQLEVDGSAPSGAPTSTLGLASTALSSSTELVHVPGPEVTPVETIDRVLAFLVFLGGLAMLIGTFMVWTTGAEDQIGWDRSDGVAVVVSGIAAAVSAGPLWVGFRHSVGRAVAIIAGLIGLMVAGVVAVTTLSNVDQTGVRLGPGVYVVLAGAIATIIAGLATNPNRQQP